MADDGNPSYPSIPSGLDPAVDVDVADDLRDVADDLGEVTDDLGELADFAFPLDGEAFADDLGDFAFPLGGEAFARWGPGVAVLGTFATRPLGSEGTGVGAGRGDPVAARVASCWSTNLRIFRRSMGVTNLPTVFAVLICDAALARARSTTSNRSGTCGCSFIVTPVAGSGRRRSDDMEKSDGPQL